MRRPVLSLAAFLLAVAPAFGMAPGSDPTTGYWLTENGRAIVQIEPCEAGVCGRTVWIAEPFDTTGRPKLDVNNPDVARRGDGLCGVALIGGFAAVGPGAWKDGWVYNPRDGNRYSAELTADGHDRLKVRGYLGLPILGKTQVWSRVADARDGCLTLSRHASGGQASQAPAN